MIADLRKRRRPEALEAPRLAGRRAARGHAGGSRARQQRLDDLRAELEQLDRQIAFKQNEEQAAAALVGCVSGSASKRRRRASPRWSELTRDYATLQTHVSRILLAKKEESKIAANLERRQIGEQFKLLDPARMPREAVQPEPPDDQPGGPRRRPRDRRSR